MTSHQSCFIAAIALLVHGLFIGPTPTALGQVREQNKTQAEAGRNVPAFKGSGVARKPKDLKRSPPPPPPRLSVGVMASLIGGEPGGLYAKLTPSQPSVANRGALVFVNAAVVEAGEGYAEWFRPSLAEHEEAAQQDYLALWLKSSAASKYFIDCVVMGHAVPFKVIGPNYSSQQTSVVAQTKGTQGHLIFALDATSAGWYGFQISGSGYNWTFYSCEVTNL